MKSRMEKYYTEKPNCNRLTKNASLYKEVYGNYTGLENLPIADNTNEIDITELKEIVKRTNHPQLRQLEVLEKEDLTIKKSQEEQREYDINKILEKAKSTSRPKEENKQHNSINYKYLTTLESQEISIPEIKRAYKEKEEIKEIELSNNEEQRESENIYMTRELKFRDKQLEVTREIKIIEEQESSPLDLFEDLKPDGNSFIVEPVKMEKDSIFANNQIESTKENEEKIISEEELEITDDDIDIIKKQPWKEKTKEDNDFYTNSYKFSKKDFVDEDEDFYDSPKKGSGILKIFLLLLAIIGLSAIIYFFIMKYGMGV